MYRRVFISLFVLILSVAAVSAAPFGDVPKGHWAYGAVNRIVDAGVIVGIDGQFKGNYPMNRYQMAAVVNRIIMALEAMGTDGGLKPQVVEDLKKLSKEFAGEITEINVRLDAFDKRLSKLEEKNNSALPAAASIPQAASLRQSPMPQEVISQSACCYGDTLPAYNQIVSRKDKRIRIGGIAKTWWQYLEGQGNEFHVRHARLLFLGDLTKDIKFCYQTEMASDFSGGADNPSMIDMNMTFNLDQDDSFRTALTVGRFIPWFTKYGCVAINTIDFVQYPLFHSRGVTIWRQAGAQVKHKSKSRNYVWTFGVVNGTELNDGRWLGDIPDRPGTSDGKDVYARVDFIPAGSKFSGAVSYWAGETDNDLDKTIFDTFVEYKSGDWRSLVEYVMATDEVAGGSDIDKESLMAQVIYRKPGSRIEYLARWEQFESDLLTVSSVPVSEYDEQWLTLGINWFLDGPNCFLGINYIDKQDKTPGEPVGDSKEAVAQLTMIF